MKTPAHKIAIEIKFLGATNFKGSRVSLRLPRWKKAKTIPYNHECRDSADVALCFLNQSGIDCDTLLDMDSHYVLACEWSQRPAIFKAFGLKESN